MRSILRGGAGWRIVLSHGGGAADMVDVARIGGEWPWRTMFAAR